MTDTDVLIVGGGPTGLTLAAHLARHGVATRIVDRAQDRAHESRALAIQPRTLEVLAPLGVAESLVTLGNPGVKLQIHTRMRTVALPLFDLGLADTAHPYLLFLSQAVTEQVLGDHLQSAGLEVERRVTFVGLRQQSDSVSALLRRDGEDFQVNARYIVGCDGAHSAVRDAAGIPFEGSAYPQTFLLADLEADGIEADAAHVFLSRHGMLFFFPLATPATWRLLVRQPDGPPGGTEPPPLEETQALVDSYTGGSVRLRDPVWATRFGLAHRSASRYREGRVFLAGDAAHVHSPAGAQGMNTGIQDAVNLAWKLAGATRGDSADDALDTYDLERRPVGRAVLRLTDRAYEVSTSTNRLVGFARTRIAPTALQLVSRFGAGRAYAFRRIAELDVRYRRSPLSVNGPGSPGSGIRAGDRLPDGFVSLDGRVVRLHAAIAGPRWTLLLCGPVSAWPTNASDHISSGTVATRRLSADPEQDVLRVSDDDLLRRLGLTMTEAAHLLVRPDGHLGYRARGHDLTGLTAYLRRWAPSALL